MCRGFQQIERERLRIRAFSTRLSVSSVGKLDLPNALTLHYLPRINGTPIEVNGWSVRPECPAFVTLHRVLLSKEAAYASRERVAVCEGARFEIYVGDVRVVRGIFRKGREEEEGESWKVECTLDDIVEGVTSAEVMVEAEGEEVVMSERVEVLPGHQRRRRRRRRRQCCELEEIPEEREEERSDACGCCECRGGDCSAEGEDGLDMEGVGWAVDVGIWAVCFGVGFLVTKASSKRFTRKRFV